MIGRYSVRDNRIKEIYKPMILRTAISFIIMAGTLIAVDHFKSGQEKDISILPFLLPLFFILFSFSTFKNLKRARVILESYTLTIYEDSILREQYNTPDIKIEYNEIKEIIQNANGSLTIKGGASINSIGIPAQIENYEEIFNILNAIKPIAKKENTFFQKYINLLAIVLVLGLMLVVYLVNNKIIVGICGAVLIAIMGYSYYVIQNSKNVDRKMKNNMRILGFVMACIFLGILGKLLKP